MIASDKLLKLWQRCDSVPGGKRLFSTIFSAQAPYFFTINPLLTKVEPGMAVAEMADRPWKRNHIKSVHAIAMCNLAEYVVGAVAVASIPDDIRWIPSGMQVQYTKVAHGKLTATATLATEFRRSKYVEPVKIDVTDASGDTVFRAVVDMHMSPKKQVA